MLRFKLANLLIIKSCPNGKQIGPRSVFTNLDQRIQYDRQLELLDYTRNPAAFVARRLHMRRT